MSKIFLIIENFYASIEAELNPQTRGKPIAITYAGTVVGVSELSKRISGIKTGMSEVYARENFPELIFMEGDIIRYRAQSNEIAGRLRIFAYMVFEKKPGAYILDIDGCPFNRWSKSVKEERIAGLLDGKHFRGGQAVNSDIAEMAARRAFTDSLKIIPPGEDEYFMASIPVSCLPLTRFGIEKLREMGIRKIGELFYIPQPILKELLGKEAKRILNFVKSDFHKNPEPLFDKLSKSIHFERNNSGSERALINSAVISMVEKIMENHVKASSIFIGLKYVDGITIGRKLKLSLTRDEVEISKARDFLLAQIWKRRTRLETGFIEFKVEPDNGQISFFDDSRRDKIADSVHIVRREYGTEAVKFAMQI